MPVAPIMLEHLLSGAVQVWKWQVSLKSICLWTGTAATCSVSRKVTRTSRRSQLGPLLSWTSLLCLCCECKLLSSPCNLLWIFWICLKMRGDERVYIEAAGKHCIFHLEQANFEKWLLCGLPGVAEACCFSRSLSWQGFCAGDRVQKCAVIKYRCALLCVLRILWFVKWFP